MLMQVLHQLKYNIVFVDFQVVLIIFVIKTSFVVNESDK